MGFAGQVGGIRQYTVKLRATDNLGATSTATTTVTVADTSPTANFTASPTSGSAPLTVNFTNSSTGYDQPLTHAWDFDNNGSIDSTLLSPSYAYANAGTYTVKLTVTDADGSLNSLIRTNYISVTSSGCANPPVKIGGVYYTSLQEAYNAAIDGDVIQSQAITFTEDLNINRNISITLKGGYDCDFISIIGNTSLKGNVLIDNGTITTEYLIIEK